MLFKRSVNYSLLFNSLLNNTKDHDAIDPFLTEGPFEILSSPSYESKIDTLFSNSHRVRAI